MTSLLDGAVAVVTGAAGGIGTALCRVFTDAGAVVVAADVDEDALGGLSEVVPVGADVTTREGARTVVEVADEHGGMTVFVNNVGHYLYARHDFVTSTEAEWDALHRINLLHVFQCCHAALPGMIERGQGGSIVNITTIEAHRGIPQHVAYSAYKTAVVGFTRSLALEVGRHRIRVNCVAPDITESRQVRVSEWIPLDYEPFVPQWVPLGRIGTPDDIANAALYLASPLGSYVTGTTIYPDGGALAAAGWYGRPDGGWTSRPVQAP